ncbi:uncharacterized protein LOC114881623 [Osmia bicornis bicornis]|uniref:uncharacterized protein LOC114881623 n=1 Tax=Osmia bicornis bicornis TaxID=1437191 RepID=UPI001EAEB4BF|nr:uncharacterized protein LOC114881623 [Osmia bicornis bicornis]
MGAAKITKGVITSRLELLERNWTSFSENHNGILDAYSKTGSESPYFKQDYMGTCEEAYVQQKAILLDLLDDVPAGKAVPTQLNATPHSLPKIDLPKFFGDYSCWANFRDLFQSLVIENHSLSNVEKLHYLKTCLTDEPELLIQNIPVTDHNFKTAWAVLTERYQNLRVLINSHLTNLMYHPSMKKESARELKNLMNRTTDAVRALEALKRPVQYWDDWLVFITTEKLDQKTRMAWETSFESTAEPSTFDQLRTFMTSRSRALEAVEGPTGPSTTPTGPSNTLKQEKKQPINSNLRFKAHATHTAGEGNRRCAICNKEHFLLFCPTYKGMNLRERKQIVTDKRLCYNCLAPHSSANCKSTKRCQLCVGKHHTSLHHACEQPTAARNYFPPQVPESNTNASENLPLERVSDVTERSTHCAMTSCLAISSVSVVLATAELMVESDRGDKIIVRALIDPCSEVSLIEESMAQLLNLRRVPEKIPVIGVGKTQTYTKGRVSVRIMSRLNKSISYNLNAYVLPRLSSYQTAKSSCSASLAYLEGLTPADPNFLSSRRINLILGADIYAQIITAGLKHRPPNTPVAQATTLGWILTGPLRQSENSDTQTNSAISLQCLMRESELVETLTRFWKLEEVLSTSHQLTEEETICEDHFSKTHKRDKSGRYVVRLPFKSSPEKLGESRGAACTLLAKLERRFRLNVDLQTAYREFLKEYGDLGHMERIPEPIQTPGSTYYLPHHGVMRESSSTTKLRVVFNASCKTSSGVSLNDLVHKGPNLLPEIFSLLLRWRKYTIVFSADVEKMYRQIRVAGEDCDFQRIVWRDTLDESLKTYKLTTVTYGMACAPYLAIRTLHQLSREEKETYPLAAHCITRDVYVDDFEKHIIILFMAEYNLPWERFAKTTGFCADDAQFGITFTLVSNAGDGELRRLNSKWPTSPLRESGLQDPSRILA